jgi:CheY-like chemotaxis protein
VAYLRQELTAPAAALAEYARDLADRADHAGDPAAARTAGQIRDRADHLLDEVHKLTAPDSSAAEQADPEGAYWRTVRHDLRAAASFIVMAGEDVLEGSSPAVARELAPALNPTLAAARRVIDLAEAVVRFGQAPDAVPLPGGSVREMLARLPGAVAQHAARADRSAPGRILIVDDNEFGRDIVARMLAQQGHEVEVLPGGREAQDRLCAADRPPVDLVLLDVMMPGMTGPELLRWLKADPRFWHLPVIMVSALGEDEGVLACIAAGAEDYLTRPVRAELLRARIAGSLEKKRLRDREAEYQARIAGLVRAIFPPAVVAEWERTGTIRPRHHEKVGVLFLDIVGFTTLCEKHRDRPEQVVRMLQEQVERYEETVRRHGVQKIKTIGDGFMGVAGLSDPDPRPALTLLKCGLDLVADTAGHPAGWQVRVGVHVGPVVTGVLGKTQFSFDLWGHTVNTAARVESNGRPGRVTLSGDAWREVADVAAGEERQVVARGIGAVTVWDFVRWA